MTESKPLTGVTESDEPPRAVREALAQARAGELLGAGQMAAIFGIGPTQFTKLHNQGAFDLFKVKPAIGRKCFSGVLVTKYLAGESVYLPTFGRKRHA